MQNELLQGFREMWNGFLANLPHIVVGLCLLLVIVGIGVFLRSFIRGRLLKKLDDQLLVNFIGRVVFLLFLVFGLVVFLNQVGLGGAASGLLAGAGVSAIVLGFAFKDIGENFLAGFFLAFSRPFSIGDVIEVLDKVGTVRSLSFRNTQIRTFDGRDIYIPNGMLIKNPLTNYTKDGLLRHDFVIGLDYGEDILEANQVILKTLQEVTDIPKSADLEPFVIIDKFDTSTVNLKIYFWTNAAEFSGSVLLLKSRVMHQVCKALLDHGFSLPADIVELKAYGADERFPLLIHKAES
jgi:small-conductance mechanosensitive channel